MTIWERLAAFLREQKDVGVIRLSERVTEIVLGEGPRYTLIALEESTSIFGITCWTGDGRVCDSEQVKGSVTIEGNEIKDNDGNVLFRLVSDRWVCQTSATAYKSVSFWLKY